MVSCKLFPSKSLNGGISYKIWIAKVPTATELQIVGIKAYMLNNKTKGKFDERSIECIFVGYSTESKADLLRDLKALKMCRICDVKFISDFNTPKNCLLVEDDAIQEQNGGEDKV